MTWGDAMKDIKEKSTERIPKNNVVGKIYKVALKKAWTEAKEKKRTKLQENISMQENGDYTAANDTGGAVADISYSTIKQNTDFTVQQGRKFARKQIEKYRERRSAEQTETTRAHAANERGVDPKQTECGTLPDAAQRPHRGADLPRQRAKEKAITAKTAPRDIRGVTQGQRQLHTAATETVRSVLHPNRPRRRAENTVRPLFVHLRHHRSAGAGRRGYRICRAYRASNGESFALGSES